MSTIVSLLIPFRKVLDVSQLCTNSLDSVFEIICTSGLLALTSRPECPWDHSWFGTQGMLWLQRHM